MRSEKNLPLMTGNRKTEGQKFMFRKTMSFLHSSRNYYLAEAEQRHFTDELISFTYGQIISGHKSYALF